MTKKNLCSINDQKYKLLTQDELHKLRGGIKVWPTQTLTRNGMLDKD